MEIMELLKQKLKVLSYWNLNIFKNFYGPYLYFLKVLSYWNLNINYDAIEKLESNLKYYHIGI